MLVTTNCKALLLDGACEGPLVGEVLFQDATHRLCRRLVVGKGFEHLPGSQK